MRIKNVSGEAKDWAKSDEKVAARLPYADDRASNQKKSGKKNCTLISRISDF
jgi:hypothetical protein